MYIGKEKIAHNVGHCAMELYLENEFESVDIYYLPDSEIIVECPEGSEKPDGGILLTIVSTNPDSNEEALKETDPDILACIYGEAFNDTLNVLENL